MNDYMKSMLHAIAFMLGLILLCYAAIFLSGCTKTEIKYVDRPFEVKVAVPTKCEYKLPPKPIIKYGTMRDVFATTSLMVADSVIIRRELREIPCLTLIDGGFETIDMDENQSK